MAGTTAVMAAKAAVSILTSKKTRIALAVTIVCVALVIILSVMVLVTLLTMPVTVLNDVTAAKSVRQPKDATDLVIDMPGNKRLSIRKRYFIRRLTPLECERCQGFPDNWTDVNGRSDSARYKALGNSVAIPCVEFIMRGVAYFLEKDGGAFA